MLELGDLEPDDKLLCLKLCIKTADLSYLSKGHAYVQVWTDRVLEEFFAQVTCRAIVDQPRADSAWARPAPAGCTAALGAQRATQWCVVEQRRQADRHFSKVSLGPLQQLVMTVDMVGAEEGGLQ